MDFDLSAEQQQFRKLVREFAQEVIAPRAEEMDRLEEFPVDIVKQMGELGLFGLPFPEEYGGQGSDFLTFCLAVEEIGRVDQSMAITLEAAVGLGANPINAEGTEEQKERWLAPMCRGDMIGAFGLTEPGGGSDAGATRTTARLEGDEWVINGSKAFITNAGTPLTGLVTITALTNGGDGGRKEISAIIVPADTPGFGVGKPYRKLGWHASDTRELSFAECRVPAANLLGERGKGYANFLRTLDDGRIAIASLAVGLAQGCLDESLTYATARHAFGKAIGSFQGIQFKIADMRVAVETARLATYHAAWLRDQGRPYKTEASIAKLYASEIAVTCAREAVQIHGGYGFMEEFPVARFYRDSKVLEIGEGTSEIQRILIARALGLPGTRQ
ncbi:MAG TPA: acyl-CoA dehydrogenase family protein [Actinomycetota bacterium]|nr:acyl-CoA dehydrogenase family protein [Actinomycetota bacterium]